MARTSSRAADIKRISYRPAARYPYDLEIFRVSDLKRRTREESMRRVYRYECHMLICVTHGRCVQVVDFKSVACEPGTLLALRPGQAHSFGCDENWDGWIVLFRPEFLLPTLSCPDDRGTVDFEMLPDLLTLSSDELHRASDAIARMREDARFDAPSGEIHVLLRHQFYAFVAWLGVIQARRWASDAPSSRALLRFTHFKKLVDQRFAEWKRVADYARCLGCTEKSLTRATTEVLGVSAKAFISARINLEAKRLLAHTDLPITVIARKLGFEEPTHFSKFFRREARCTPAEFRLQHVSKSITTDADS